MLVGVRIVPLAMLAAIFAAPPVVDDAFEPVEISTPLTASAISGVVHDSRTGAAIAGASVTLSCDCLEGAIVQQSDERGRYRFFNLPPGVFTVGVNVKGANFDKVIEVPARVDYHCNFAFDPEALAGMWIRFDTRDGEWKLFHKLPVRDTTCDRWCRQLRRVSRRAARRAT